MLATCTPRHVTVALKHLPPPRAEMRTQMGKRKTGDAKPTRQRRSDRAEGFGERDQSLHFFLRPFLRFPCACWRLRPRGRRFGRMARAAVVAVLAVAVLLACLPPAAAASPYRAAAAALRRLETAAPMDTAQGLREKTDVTKIAAEDVSTTGFGAESEREVPTGPDPIHHHGRGPRRQSPSK
ncbi:hypothetical protein U9M48_032916 [Paspalum notatum var. saurae]|uniref:Uncharacterized protein n=1 Tax=Paspalum notatum var. saurae TaxID=547442 RepID=A0AAQ3U9J1_PASNO